MNLKEKLSDWEDYFKDFLSQTIKDFVNVKFLTYLIVILSAIILFKRMDMVVVSISVVYLVYYFWKDKKSGDYIRRKREKIENKIGFKMPVKHKGKVVIPKS